MKILKNKMKLVITIAIVLAFLWFLVLYPIISFNKEERILREAGERYFELNKNELPTGKRIKTVSMETLAHKAFLKEDLYAPYSMKTCSPTKSWVKVRSENNEYHYYVYLKCGVMHSLIDHSGPEIKLNGDINMSIGLGSNFSDPGIKSVVDNADGRMKIDDVIVKGKVDTSKIGIYEITYTAVDSLGNKTTVTREVEVVQKLYDTIASKLNNVNNFVGEPSDNYLLLSHMLYRIYGINDNHDVIIVADEDVANVNYSRLDKWLEYYYNHLNDSAKKKVVKSQFCNMQLSDTSLDTTQCNSYTSKKNVYIPSAIEVNKANGDGNFMKTATISWVANFKDSKHAYVTRNIFYDDSYGKSFISYNIDDNYGVRPMMVIKGGSMIVSGDGTRRNPYMFDDSKKGSSGEYVNKRETGEYILYGGILWRIIDTLEDGTVKIISIINATGAGNSKISCFPDPDNNKILYNPKDHMSIAYYINNDVLEYVDTSKMVLHNIDVPIYKNKIIYGKEVEIKKYKVMLSAPNMYDMFSAQVRNLVGYYPKSYWLLNSSNANRMAGVVTDIGVPLNESVPEYYSAGVRVVGYLKKDVTISSGNGTEVSPYKIK